MINNTDILNYIKEIKQACDEDKHGGVMWFARQKMIELGFFDEMPESSLDPFRPAPENWTAFEFAVFDNGEPKKPKRKRNYFERSKVRFGGQMKMWTRDKIDFRSKAQISWKANTYFWNSVDALQVAAELLEQKYIDQDTVDSLNQMITHLGSDWMYSIPMLSAPNAGTRWMKNHLIALEMVTPGELGRVAFVAPNISLSGTTWSESDASGKDLDDKVVGQMRLGAHAGFDSWATQPF